MHQLCLNMIVKNESQNLPKLFASLHEVIDYYIICDTGSTDNTIQVIKDLSTKYNIPGEIHQDPWKNFGHNRQLALERAVNKAKYLLFIDADEVLTYKYKVFPQYLISTLGYSLLKKTHNNEHHVPHIINIENNNVLGWEWKGVVHNYLNVINKDLIKGQHIQILDGVVINVPNVGKGGKTGGLTLRDKFLKDAALFTKELEENPEDTRSQFYLAQSYRDSEENELAITHYKRRCLMGGWKEEIYYSHLMIGRLLQTLNRPFEESIEEYITAQEVLPSRAEAFYHIGNWYYLRGDYKKSYYYGNKAVQIEKPLTGLFLMSDIYDFKMYDEYAVSAFRTGDFQEAVKYFLKLLKINKMPPGYEPRVRKNVKICLTRLTDTPSLDKI
jgi:glycosyltransferase involved in cell wall biosynthesis